MYRTLARFPAVGYRKLLEVIFNLKDLEMTEIKLVITKLIYYIVTLIVL